VSRPWGTLSPMALPYEEFDLSAVATYPLDSRPSKVTTRDFARPYAPGAGLHGLLASLPTLLAARDFRAIVLAMLDARERGAPVVWGLGAHVVKTGLGPVLVDLMGRGFVSAIAMNGAGVIHDFEIALAGQTSEDVDAALGPGRFGMARETGEELNAAIAAGARDGLGLGQAVMRLLASRQPEFANASILCGAARHQVPVTVHVAMGPTSSTCTQPRRARRSARPACATSGTSSRPCRGWLAACS